MERKMTIAQAKAFMAEVQAIVEREDHGHCDYQTYQHRHQGAVWGEGISVDVSYDEDHGCYHETVGIHYYVQQHDGEGVACLRQDSREGGVLANDKPFYGSAKEAADYLLKDYRECFDDEDY